LQLEALEAKSTKSGAVKKSARLQIKSQIMSGLKSANDFRNGIKEKAIVLKINDVNFSTKAVMTEADSLTGDVIAPTRVPGIIYQPQEDIKPRDIMQVFSTDSNVVGYTEETLYTNLADVVEENPSNGKNESSLTLEFKRAEVETIAHLFRLSTQMFDDLEGAANYLSLRLVDGLTDAESTQILYGTGTAPDLDGWADFATPFISGLLAGVTDPTEFDVIQKCILILRLAKYRPDFVMVDPNGFDSMVSAKDGEGRYLFEANVRMGNVPMSVRGIPIFESTYVQPDDFFVGTLGLNGAFPAAALHDRKSVEVRFFEEDRDNVQKNLITVRGEQRLAQTAYRPQGIIYGNFVTALAPYI
jgi:HK97 family phage major capsid protein